MGLRCSSQTEGPNVMTRMKERDNTVELPQPALLAPEPAPAGPDPGLPAGPDALLVALTPSSVGGTVRLYWQRRYTATAACMPRT